MHDCISGKLICRGWATWWCDAGGQAGGRMEGPCGGRAALSHSLGTRVSRLRGRDLGASVGRQELAHTVSSSLCITASLSLPSSLFHSSFLFL